jgi:hypothetical protein
MFSNSYFAIKEFFMHTTLTLLLSCDHCRKEKKRECLKYDISTMKFWLLIIEYDLFLFYNNWHFHSTTNIGVNAATNDHIKLFFSLLKFLFTLLISSLSLSSYALIHLVTININTIHPIFEFMIFCVICITLKMKKKHYKHCLQK